MSANAEPALDDAVDRARIAGTGPRGLDENLFVEAGAGSGKTQALVERVIALVGGGLALRHIVAITFTERAAAELRMRVRQELEGRLASATSTEQRERWGTALGEMDGAAIGTLHAFAQRLLTEHPLVVGLPPNADVLDEVASHLGFEQRWRRFRQQLLDDPVYGQTLLLLLATGVKLEQLHGLARAFDTDWDLVEAGVPPDALPPAGPGVDLLITHTERVAAKAQDSRDPDDRMAQRLGEFSAWAQQLRAADPIERVRLLKDACPGCKVGNTGRAPNWGVDLNEVRAEVRALDEHRLLALRHLSEACLRHIASGLRGFVLDGAHQRQADGRLEFHDLLVLARRLLRTGGGWPVRRILRERYRTILLDEFQDTDPIQLELAVLLASPDPDAGAQDWRQIAIDPGRLFVVGDPKQSIYRFRRADLKVFLDAQQTLDADNLELRTNFRTTPPVLDWINHVFAQLITAQPGTQPAYHALAVRPGRACPDSGPGVLVLGSQPHDDAPLAEVLRDREAADVAQVILSASGQWSVSNLAEDAQRPARLSDIAVLLPARTSLRALEGALDRSGIAYRVETSSLVYSTPMVRDVLLALQAVADPSDQLALAAALRSAVFGCGDDDLFTYRRRHGGKWSYQAPVPPQMPAGHPVAEALRYLHTLHVDHIWRSPSELLQRLIEDRRLFELGYAAGRPRDLWRRLRFLVDHARAWSEAEGGTLREYLAWARLQASEATTASETVLPETDDDAVRILTVHGAKGLEFPITILSGLSTRPYGRRGVQVLWPAPGAEPEIKMAAISTLDFEELAPIDEQMSHHERLRLLYVACTRARDHLVVSLHRRTGNGDNSQADKRTSAEIIAQACQSAPHQVEFTGGWFDQIAPTSWGAAPAVLPPEEQWRAELDEALRSGTRPRTIGATAVGHLPAPVRLEEEPDSVEAGLRKEPRDLDLPPWMRGRYGTAIGRAVHAVLQTIDLATGEGLDAAVAAQAAAEAVVGRESDVRVLVRAALESPVVAQAAAATERWRETFVAVPVDGVTVEGYIDLLFRTEDGLVVVDYKTAPGPADLAQRTVAYRLQAATYALAVESSTDEHVVRVVLCYLTPQGAFEQEVTDLAAAIAEARDRVGFAAASGRLSDAHVPPEDALF